MTVPCDEDLYRAGISTALAAWEQYAAGTKTGSLRRHGGVVVAVFPDGPERAVYNNAILDRHSSPRVVDAAVDALEHEYAVAGVDNFAVWTHETDQVARDVLERRRYVITETTRAMAISLDGVAFAPPEVAFVEPDWATYLRLFLPPDLLAGVAPGVFGVAMAAHDDETVSAAISYDHEQDCGIYNVGTLEHARRRGLGSAVTAMLAFEAHERGCATVSLQASPMAERLYGALGFRDLGQIVEYGPCREVGSRR